MVNRRCKALRLCHRLERQDDQDFELQLSHAEGEKPFTLLQTVKFNEAVTAVTLGTDLVLAVGKEDGQVEILQRKKQEDSQEASEEWATTLKIEDMAPEQINQLAFRPPVLEDGDDAVLASASEDGIVRLTRISGFNLGLTAGNLILWDTILLFCVNTKIGERAADQGCVRSSTKTSHLRALAT